MKNNSDKKYGRRCIPWYNEKGEVVGTMMVIVDLEKEKREKAKQKHNDNEPYTNPYTNSKYD